MKYFIIIAILLYQKVFAAIIKQINGTPAVCRFSPTCSEYAIKSIRENGIFKGFRLSFARFISCRP